MVERLTLNGRVPHPFVEILFFAAMLESGCPYPARFLQGRGPQRYAFAAGVGEWERLLPMHNISILIE
jgi:hypothetical protein